MRRRSKALEAAVAGMKSAPGTPSTVEYPPGYRTLITKIDPSGETVAAYAMDLIAERNGTMILHHRRPSGKWNRMDRATHPAPSK